MIYIHKLLPYLLYPLTIVLFLLFCGLFWKKRFPITIACLILLITSSPFVSRMMWISLEANQLRKLPSQVQNADAIVVLSGMIGAVNSSNGITYEWGDPDRFFGGVELMNSGKAEYIIFTGGKMPWQRNLKAEGTVLAEFAKDMGIKPNQIIITPDVLNTQQEAEVIKAILNKNNLKKVILVTSAFHMPRAKMLFENEGIEIETYPVDSKVGISDITPMDFMPDAAAFSKFHDALREFIGRAYYSFKYK